MAGIEVVKVIAVEKIISSGKQTMERGVIVAPSLEAAETAADILEKNGAIVNKKGAIFGSTEEECLTRITENHIFGFNFNPRMCSWVPQKDQNKPWVNPENPSNN